MANRDRPEAAHAAGTRKDKFSYPPAPSVSLFLVGLPFGAKEREKAVLYTFLLVPLERIAAKAGGSKILTYQEGAPISLG